MAGYVYVDGFPNSLDKEINKEFDSSLMKATSDYEMIGLKTESAPAGNTYTESEITGLGTVRAIGEGQGVTFDIPVAGHKRTIGYSKFGLGMGITEEMVADHIHPGIIKASGTMATSAVQNLNVNAFDLFNGAFTTTLGWDGKAVIATDHTTLKSGDTINNNIGGGALSATAIEAMFTYANGGGSNSLVTEEGFPTRINLNTLLVSPSDFYDAQKLLKGELVVGSANNDINTVNPSWGAVPNYGIKTSPFLTSATAYFMYGSDLDFRLYWKKKPIMESSVDFHTSTKLYKVTQRYAVFAMQYKGIVGHQGT